MITKEAELQAISTAVVEYVKEFNKQTKGNLSPTPNVVKEVLKFSRSDFDISRGDIARIVRLAQRKM